MTSTVTIRVLGLSVALFLAACAARVEPCAASVDAGADAPPTGNVCPLSVRGNVACTSDSSYWVAPLGGRATGCAAVGCPSGWVCGGLADDEKSLIVGLCP